MKCSGKHEVPSKPVGVLLQAKKWSLSGNQTGTVVVRSVCAYLQIKGLASTLCRLRVGIKFNLIQSKYGVGSKSTIRPSLLPKAKCLETKCFRLVYVQ